MKNKLTKIAATVSDSDMTRTLLSMRFSGYLYETGWIKSYKEKAPVNAKDEPIPWVTYSFIEFITPRLHKALDVFEYGSGNSTLFYSGKVRSVTSVEHDEAWLQKISKQITENVELIYEKLDYNSAYCRTAVQNNKKYDLIVVDGRDRVNCIIQSVNALKEAGVMILDDSERTEYKEGISFLSANGFKFIDFWGMAPGVLENKSTSVFYRSNNCLNI